MPAFRDLLTMPDCPQCLSASTRKSRKQTSRKHPLKWYESAYRCEDCGHRFVATDREAITGRIAMWAAGALITLGGIVAVLRPSAPEPLPTQEDTAAAPSNPLEPTPYDFTWNADIETLTGDAKAGDAESQFQLAMILLNTFERTGELSLQYDSHYWLQESAAQDYQPAQTALGNHYLAGRGVVQDFAQASEWFLRAAMQGNPEAMYGLGNMARMGRAEGVSLAEAYAWLNVASARGERRADEARRNVLDRLSAEELKKAQRLSRELDRKIPRPPPSADS
jgi:predicted RNA-binding Zn-ribbon protein involved in translation (DUF1610 family)